MITYHIIDKYAYDNLGGEMKHYTFDELKAYFEPDEEDLPEYHEKWSEINDLYDLEEYLNWQYGGDEVPYSFQEDDIESLEVMQRANEYFRNCHYD